MKRAVEVAGLVRKGRLKDVSISLASGSLALIGANGAGKSTLLHVLVGRLTPHSGTAHLFGHLPRSLAAAQLRAYVPQSIVFPAHLQVFEILQAAARAKRCPFDLAEAAAARMGLSSYVSKRAGALSGGMTQRLALAAALMDEPKLWLLDEPASALDGGGLERLAEWARSHAANGGSLIVSAHRPEEVEAFADEALLLKAGRVVGRDAVHDLFEYELFEGADGPRRMPEGWRVKRRASALLAPVLGGNDE